MQTFLPYPDFRASASALDERRLGKQRVETLQILRALTWHTYGWRNHPATKMWRGCVRALVCYGVAVCDEWQARGRADAVRESLLSFAAPPVPDQDTLARGGELPWWLGNEALHLSHRSALVRKDPEFYRAQFPDVPDDLPYVWPPPVFPSWPLRRGHDRGVPLDAAATLLGLDAVRPEQRAAVDAVCEGRSYRLALPAGGGATTTGLLAGLCTPGATAWLVDGQQLRLTHPRPEPAPATTGTVSPSIARPPSTADRASVDEEVASRPEFRFFRAGDAVGGLAELDDVGLVVLDGVPDSDALRLPDAVPVLTLATVDAAGPG